MVTCQSANQLKTPAKVSWAFKMVSVWFTRPVVLKLFQEEAPLRRVNSFVAPTNFRLYQKQINLQINNAGTTILFVA